MENIMDNHRIRIEEEFFRFLFIEGNAYDKQTMAQRLGTSMSYFDKIYRNTKNFFEGMYPASYESYRTKNKAYSRFKYDAYQVTENILVWFYRQTYQTKRFDEILCYVSILQIIGEQPSTRSEIADKLVNELGGSDKKLSRYLNPLLDLQVIRKVDDTKPERFVLNNSLLEHVSDEELLQLYQFVNFAANTSLSSVPGYFLLDTLKAFFQFKDEDRKLDFFSYRDNNFMRILDEYKCQELIKAINEQCYVSFYYFSKTSKIRAFSKNMTPPKRERTIPLRLLYDHQYGRWYLIGKGSKRNEIRSYKLEGVSDIELEKQKADPMEWAHYIEKVEQDLANSWLLKPNKLTDIVIKFYKEEESVRERLQREKRWGEIIEENDEYVLFKTSVNGTSEITPWIRSFGAQAEVLEPRKLRESFANEWKKMMELYEDV